MAIFGAKNPHTQFTVVGGVTNYDALKPDRIAEYKALTDEVIAFIRDFYIMPALEQSANIAVLSVAGAACLAFFFSAVGFRPLGRLRRQLAARYPLYRFEPSALLIRFLSRLPWPLGMKPHLGSVFPPIPHLM